MVICSGGPLLLPDVGDTAGTVHHLAIGSGKDANIYALDRGNMGKFKGNADNIYQLITRRLSGCIYSKPSYFNSAVYYGAVNDTIKAFPIMNALLANSPSSHSAHSFPLSGYHSLHFRKRHDQWHCLGLRE